MIQKDKLKENNMKTTARSTVVDVTFCNIFLLVLSLNVTDETGKQIHLSKFVAIAGHYHHADIKKVEQEKCVSLDESKVAQINADMAVAMNIFDALKLSIENQFAVTVLGVRTKDNDKICIRYLMKVTEPPIKPMLTHLI